MSRVDSLFGNVANLRAHVDMALVAAATADAWRAQAGGDGGPADPHDVELRVQLGLIVTALENLEFDVDVLCGNDDTRTEEECVALPHARRSAGAAARTSKARAEAVAQGSGTGQVIRLNELLSRSIKAAGKPGPARRTP